MNGYIMGPRSQAGTSLDAETEGSALLEALVALALLGVALLMTAAIVGLHAKTARKLADQRKVAEFVDSRHEELRGGGLVTCRTGTTELDVGEVFVVESFSLTATVEELAPHGLCKVQLHARYRSGGFPAQFSVETMIWRPQ